MIIDLGFLIFVMYGFYLGYAKGILKTLFAILSIFIAVILSMKFSPFMIEIVDNLLKLGPQLSMLIGFVISFLLIMLIVRFIGRKVEKIFKAVRLNFINKIVGGAMMTMIFVVSYSALVWFLDQTKLISEAQKEQSVSYELLKPIPTMARGAAEQIKPAFRGFYEKSLEAIEGGNTKDEPTINEAPEK